LRQRNPWDRPARIRKLILFLIMSAGFFIFSSYLLEALPTESPLSVDRNLSSAAKKA
jgi:zona occludens toxin (predicted ATPase)